MHKLTHKVGLRKIKLFKASTDYGGGSTGQALITPLEKKVNAWLAKNPKIKVISIDTKNSTTGRGGYTDYMESVIVSVVYTE